jgi:hypothetical protein
MLDFTPRFHYIEIPREFTMMGKFAWSQYNYYDPVLEKHLLNATFQFALLIQTIETHQTGHTGSEHRLAGLLLIPY